jgi:site-specific recombinase XerD
MQSSLFDTEAPKPPVSHALAVLPAIPPARVSTPLPAPGAAEIQLFPIITNSGPGAAERFLEFFTVTIRNPNTRRAYGRAVGQFLTWCEAQGLRSLAGVRPMQVAAYIETMPGQPQTKKQTLAAIRMLYDWLVTGQIVPTNPATSVRGPRYSIKKGKTPVLAGEDTRALLESIETSHVVGLRDRALIALMVYSFARVGAVTGMSVSDYYQNGKRWWVRLHEKNGKFHEVPVHHAAEEYLDAYLDAAGIRGEAKSPLFRTTRGQSRKLTKNGIQEREVLDMIKRRAEDAKLPASTCCHTFRATGITTYRKNGGTLEHAQEIANHASPRTTQLYDRSGDQITLDEIEKIVL